MADAEFDVVTIGAGGGAYPGALRLARAGMRVLMVDPKEGLGGNCLAEGCIPSKVIREMANLFQTSASTSASPPRPIDYARIIAHKDAVQNTRYAQHAREVAQTPLAILQKGVARIRDAHTICVDGDKGTTTVKTRYMIIGSGAEVFMLKIPGAELCLTSTDLFRRNPTLKERPESMIIIGGGAIGVETASMFAALGARVTILQRAGQLLPNMDPGMVAALTAALDPKIQIIVNADVGSVERMANGGMRVHYTKADGPTHVDAAIAVMAVGRAPMIPDGFSKLDLAFDRHGIGVDRAMRTQAPHIYACGDVNGRFPLFHVAVRESLIAAHNILAGNTPCDYMDYTAIPNAIFTIPGAAQVGLTRVSAGGQTDLALIESAYDYRGDARAQIMGDTRGGIHLFFEAGNLRLRGGWVVGIDAEQIIGDIGLAVAAGMTAYDLARFPAQHPMAAEGIGHAARTIV
ncbi:dihydrolipoyl dehydrogenase [Acidiferrobacter sp.]|uniref:dihydrolipoyl dehydrogenase n=1 Tax=Acidiferrobacter sp. TaxID=1872107 RepID=UPI002614A8D9|nr:dihydrolipoyl dehydrogenase [Acidiferrobacter sp.]